MNKSELEISKYGDKRWQLNGELHREDGPAIETVSGYKEWWINGKLHREDGPAVEASYGYKAWYLNGIRHRVDGPAIMMTYNRNQWYLNGNLYSSLEDWFQKLTLEQQYNYLWNLGE
jgi:hypothetical protein